MYMYMMYKYIRMHEALTLYFKVGCGVTAAMRVINYTAVVIGIGHGDVEDGEVGLPHPLWQCS